MDPRHFHQACFREKTPKGVFSSYKIHRRSELKHEINRENLWNAQPERAETY